MAKSKPVELKVTGSQQVAQIQAVFDAKTKADAAKLEYDNARKGALPTIMNKIFQYWKKRGTPTVGAYELVLNDGTKHTVNVQNRQSSKAYDPADAKPILEKLNATVEGTKLTAKDVYDIVVNHGIHPEAMARPKIRERVLAALVALEQEMKTEGSLPPEISIVIETKTLVLADHCIDRVVALTSDIDTAMNALDNPISANLMTPKPVTK